MCPKIIFTNLRNNKIAKDSLKTQGVKSQQKFITSLQTTQTNSHNK